MRLVGKVRLSPLLKGNDKTQSWTRSWVADISQAHWKHESEIYVRFPKVSKLDHDLFFFSPHHNNVGIEVKFAFLQGTALIKNVRKA